MERFITKALEQWKLSKHRKPLILRGARQVGKTYSVEQFAKSAYPGTLHTVNLEKRPDLHSVFDADLDAIRILNALEVLLNVKIDPKRDVLFFDEIQACPPAITALRYFYEALPDLHVIAAGSLLEFALSDISFPVGRVQMLTLFPMCFAEYLMAVDKIRLAEVVLAKAQPLEHAIHRSIQEELRKYFFVGGLPECVKRYADTRRMADVSNVQDDLLATYRQDFHKYTPAVDAYCLNDVLTTAAGSVGQQIKYTRLSQAFSGPTNKRAFDVLCTARLLHKVRSASPSGLPLGAGMATSRFKALLLDIGLLTRLSGLQLHESMLHENLLGIFKGALAEQFAGQEFLCAGQLDLFYWAREARGSTAEVDYLLARNGKIVPVEVKSGASGSLRSMHLLLESFPAIEDAFVLSDASYGKTTNNRLTFLPLYSAWRLGSGEPVVE